MKLLIVQKEIPHYRVELFRSIEGYCDVSYLVTKFDKSFCRESISYISYKAFGMELFMPKKNVKYYDKILLEGNIRNLWVFVACLLFPSKIILWGNWPTGKFSDVLRKWVSIRVRQNWFYSEAHRNYFRLPISQSIVGNVIKVDEPVSRDNSDRLVIGFVGSLNKRKGLLEIMDVLFDLHETVSFCFQIIGDGDQKQDILTHPLAGLEDFFVFHGRLNEGVEKNRVISSFDVMLSWRQIGLSVWDAIGRGVPVITNNDAITGGEIDHVINGITGWRCRHSNELKDLLAYLSTNKQVLDEVQRTCLIYYKNNGFKSFNKELKKFIES
jgi:glycosyltransferase involved in cell wall biosynthesis